MSQIAANPNPSSRRRMVLVAGLLIAILLVAIGFLVLRPVTSTVAPTGTPVAVATATPTVAPTARPTVAPTPTPTATPVPTPSVLPSTSTADSGSPSIGQLALLVIAFAVVWIVARGRRAATDSTR